MFLPGSLSIEPLDDATSNTTPDNQIWQVCGSIPGSTLITICGKATDSFLTAANGSPELDFFCDNPWALRDAGDGRKFLMAGLSETSSVLTSSSSNASGLALARPKDSADFELDCRFHFVEWQLPKVVVEKVHVTPQPAPPAGNPLEQAVAAWMR